MPLETMCHFKSIRKFHTQIRAKLPVFRLLVTLKFDRWHWKTIGHPFYATSSFVHYFKAINEQNWSYSPKTLNSGKNLGNFCPARP